MGGQRTERVVVVMKKEWLARGMEKLMGETSGCIRTFGAEYLVRWCLLRGVKIGVLIYQHDVSIIRTFTPCLENVSEIILCV